MHDLYMLHDGSLRKRRGFNVAAYDIVYGENSEKGSSHDFLQSAGFLCSPHYNHAYMHIHAHT